MASSPQSFKDFYQTEHGNHLRSNVGIICFPSEDFDAKGGQRSQHANTAREACLKSRICTYLTVKKESHAWLFNVTTVQLFNVMLSVQSIECFHSRGQYLCKFIGTKESVCIRKEFTSQRICLGHQHGRRFIVLGHQYGRRDVLVRYGHGGEKRKPKMAWNVWTFWDKVVLLKTKNTKQVTWKADSEYA